MYAFSIPQAAGNQRCFVYYTKTHLQWPDRVEINRGCVQLYHNCCSHISYCYIEICVEVGDRQQALVGRLDYSRSCCKGRETFGFKRALTTLDSYDTQLFQPDLLYVSMDY